jgi:hypothetical protein
MQQICPKSALDNKQILMKKCYLFLASVFFLIYGCNKQTNHLPAKPATSYLLTEETWTGVPTNGQGFTFTYNDNQQVIKIRWIQWYTGSAAGAPIQLQRDTINSYFEYSNGLLTKSWDDESGPDQYAGYEYNNQGLLIRRTYYGDLGTGDSGMQVITKNVPERLFLYSYDAHNNLILVIDKNPNGMYNNEYDFTYTDSNNLMSVTNYYYGQSPTALQKAKYEWTGYDKGVNFIKALNGYPESFIWDNSLGAYSSSSPNNILSENYYLSTNINDPFGAPIQYIYTYQYNADGLPTTMTSEPWIVIYQYQKI